MRELQPLAHVPRGKARDGRLPALGLVGFFGHGNYGDELFLEVYRDHLGTSFKLDSILDPRHPGSLARWLGSDVRNSDALLIGGGDIVMPWSGSRRYWLRSYLQRPVFVVGVGVPTWRPGEPEVINTLRRFFQHPSVRMVAARDIESSSWIAHQLEPAVPILTTPDLACALSLPEVERPSDPPIFGIAVRARSEPDDLTHVRQLCRRAVELGYRVRQIVLATGETRKRDLVATASLDLPDAELVSSDDLAVISRAIGECTAMASMKFHGVVVGTMYGLPTIVMMPTTKNRSFIRRVGRPDLLSAYNDPTLPDHLDRDMAPIAPAARAELREDATAMLRRLREQILQAVALS